MTSVDIHFVPLYSGGNIEVPMVDIVDMEGGVIMVYVIRSASLIDVEICVKFETYREQVKKLLDFVSNNQV